jgi:hypothetical protein
MARDPMDSIFFGTEFSEIILTAVGHAISTRQTLPLFTADKTVRSKHPPCLTMIRANGYTPYPSPMEKGYRINGRAQEMFAGLCTSNFSLTSGDKRSYVGYPTKRPAIRRVPRH